MESNPRRRRICRTALALVLLLASALVPAQAQKFKVLHTFHESNGAAPLGALVRDSAGNLYGTTVGGGNGPCNTGCGTAFKLDRTGKQVWLHSFRGGNGDAPGTSLLRDIAGNLYGTATAGGNPECQEGCGVAFKLDATGKETVLRKFKSTPDAYYPESPLIKDHAGDLYGSSYMGGAYGAGTVFKIHMKDDGKWDETVLHSFGGTNDGALLYAGLIFDAAGNLYGAASNGGNSGFGTVFELTPNGDGTWTETTLHQFGSRKDGLYPYSSLIFDAAGNLYGTTLGGGNCRGGRGCGVVFELSPRTGGHWIETVLYTFCSLPHCADGSELWGPLIRDSAGNLYGTAGSGGAYPNCMGGGCGVVFKLDMTGKETVLHTFSGGSDGASPTGGLVMDDTGNLYGTATYGADTNCNPPYGCGTVFKIAP